MFGHFAALASLRRSPQPSPKTLMKVTHRILAALIAVAALSPLGAQDIKINIDANKPADAKAAKPAATAPAAAPSVTAPTGAPQFTHEQKLEAWGWLMARQIGLDRLELSENEAKALAKGMFLVALRQNPGFDLDAIGPQAQEVIREKVSVVQAREKKILDGIRDENHKRNAAYLAELDKKPEVQKTSTGLRYEIILKGTGSKPRVDQTVSIHYTGKLLTGDTFDSTVGRDAGKYVVSDLFLGWKEGIPLIAQGGKIRLHIPPDLAFGDDGQGPIPPGALLVYDIDLIDVKDTPKEEAKK